MNVSSRYPVQTVCVIRYRNSGCVASGNDIHVQDTTRQSLVNVMPDERTRLQHMLLQTFSAGHCKALIQYNTIQVTTAVYWHVTAWINYHILNI